MRIAVMGTGGIGGFCGAKLAAKGADVFFITRSEHLNAMQRSGLKLLSALGHVTLDRVTATDNPARRAPADIVLFTVKGPDTDAAIDVIAT
jgi:2-dehydropantoate 2-reductase